MDNICDSHFHVFGTPDRFPIVPTSAYVPPVLSISDYQAAFAPMGVRRMVLVQPSCYGSDNRCMLEALATLGARGRAVVAVAPDVSEAELRDMHEQGARGIRVNAVGGSTLSIAQLRNIAPRLQELGWHVQTYLPKGRLPDLADDLLATGLTVVLDHFGAPDPTLGMDQPTVKALARMLATGRCWVKLSAPFRISSAGAPFADALPYAHALVKMRPDRLVWGSDWPYIHYFDKLPRDYDPLKYFTDVLRDPAQLRDNARELYQFD